MPTDSHLKEPLMSYGKGNRLLAGGFRFNGASTPTEFTGAFMDTVVRDGAGIWTVTFLEDWQNANKIISVGGGLTMDADAALSFMQFGPLILADGTLVVRTFTEAGDTTAAADIAAGSNLGNWCYFNIVLKYGEVTDGQ